MNFLNNPVWTGIMKQAATSGGSNLLPNLAAYWKLDEASGTAFDAIGANNLTAYGSPVSATGKVGNGRELIHASNQWLGNASPSGLAPGTNDFSISVWVNLTGSGGSGWDALVHWGNQAAEADYFWLLRHPAGVIYFQLNDGSGYNHTLSSGTVSNSVWTHVAVIMDRDAHCKIYLNASLDTTNTAITSSNGDISPAGGIGIGAYYADPSLSMDGVIDEVKIWHRALTPENIEEDYENGMAGIPLL